MKKRALGNSGLEIAPLVFGCNVFGWTVDEPTAFTLLDQFVDSGLNAVDTADVYSSWAPGNSGGESETIIGNWLKNSPNRREKTVIITKVGMQMAPGKKGLSASRIIEAAEDSLRRLQTDYIDLYLSHAPDAETPIEETLRAYETLIAQGKVRVIGASNYDAGQLGEALTVAVENNLPRYEVLQPEYNLYDRDKYEGELRDLCIKEGLGVITYYSLASGFLSGKYRSQDDLSKSVRGQGASKYLNERGFRILEALDIVAQNTGVNPAEVAIAWVIAREGVTAPIASATSPDQLESLIRAANLELPPSDIQLLNQASN